MAFPMSEVISTYVPPAYYDVSDPVFKLLRYLYNNNDYYSRFHKYRQYQLELGQKLCF